MEQARITQKNYPKRFNEPASKKNGRHENSEHECVISFPHRIHETGISIYTIHGSYKIGFGIHHVFFEHIFWLLLRMRSVARAPLCFQCHVFSATKRLRLDHPQEPHWGSVVQSGASKKVILGHGDDMQIYTLGILAHLLRMVSNHLTR